MVVHGLVPAGATIEEIKALTWAIPERGGGYGHQVLDKNGLSD